MDLVRQSKPFGGGLDFCGATYPHVYRQAKDRIGSELMQIYVEVPEDVDDGWVKGESKPSKQEIAKNDNFIIARLRHGLFAGGPHGPDHAILLKCVHVGSVNQASAEGVRLENHLCGSVAPPLQGHDYALLRSRRRTDGQRRSYSKSFEV
jgi:hypothetical protein